MPSAGEVDGKSGGFENGTQQLICTPAGLSFRKVVVGKSETLPVLMTNTGSTSVTVSKMQANAPGFEVANLKLPLTLPPGKHVGFEVVFTPTGLGEAHGTFGFDSNASDPTLPLQVSGVGVNNWALGANPTHLQFGEVAVGRSSTLPVTLTNSGSSTIKVGQDGTTGAGFKFNGLHLPLTLKGGQSFTFNVTFSPQSLGVSDGSVFVTNAADPILTVPLSGTGTASHGVSLSWTASSSLSVIGYNVFRSVAWSGPYIQLNSVLDPMTKYTDSSVVSGATYFYATTAVDSSGQQSTFSNRIRVEIP